MTLENLNNFGYCKTHNAYFDKDIGYCIFCKTETLEKKLDADIESRKNWEDAWVKVSNSYLKWNDNLTKLEEVLQNQLKFRIKWSEKAIFVDGAERLSLDQVAHLEDQIKFYGKLLEKLARQTEREKIDSLEHRAKLAKDYAKEIEKIKTEKKEVPYMVIKEPQIFGHPKKASGGEKELPKHENGLNHMHGINSETAVPDSKLPDKCEECGGYRMGENMMHNDWCSQCTTTTTAENLAEKKPLKSILKKQYRKQMEKQ